MRKIDSKLDVALKDVLHNCDDRSGASDEYCRGIVVAVVSVLCGLGFEFKAALAEAQKRIPVGSLARATSIYPESWVEFSDEQRLRAKVRCSACGANLLGPETPRDDTDKSLCRDCAAGGKGRG